MKFLRAVLGSLVAGEPPVTTIQDSSSGEFESLWRAARVQANQRASREGRPMLIYAGERLAGRHPGAPIPVVYVRSEDEGAPLGAELVEVVGLHDGMSPEECEHLLNGGAS